MPWRPGAPVALNPDARPARDELDELLDEVFGEPTREGPGAFDVVLLTGGAGLVLASKFAGLSNGAVVLGVAMIALGLILPIRDVWQRVVRRRAARRLRTTLAQGLPLNVGHPATQALVSAYQQVAGTDQSLTAFGLETLEAAHLAMIEVAGLLQGRLPTGSAEEEYVATRTRALTELAGVMPRVVMDAAPEEGGGADELPAREAAVAAVRELEALTGGSSVARIEFLRSVVKRADR